MSTKQQHRQKGTKQKHRRQSGSSPAAPEPKISLQQRIDPGYLEDEARVKQLIESRRDNLEPTQSDLEVLFFTEGLPLEKDVGSQSPSFKSLDSNDDAPTNYMNSIVQIDEDMLFERVQEEFKYDASLLYFPSSEKPSLPNVQSSSGLISLASQGIHEARVPKLNQKNKHLLYNRLLEEDKYHLFNKNGELNGLQDHHQTEQQGQLFKYEATARFPIKFVLVNEEELNVRGRLEESKVLLLTIDHLKFHHHYLFSEETFLATAIEKTCKAYAAAKKAGGPEKFLQKVTILKFSLDEELNKESERYKQMLVEILELRNKYHLESKLQRERLQTILEDYKTLKDIRNSQKFNSTTLKLTVMVDSLNKSPHMEELLEEEINETFALQNLEYLEAKKDRKQRRRSSTVAELDNLPALPAKPNLDSIKSNLRKKFKDCHFDINQQRRMNFSLHRIPKTSAESNIVEQKRLASLANIKIQLKVFCNNALIEVLSGKVSEDFKVCFNSSMAIRLTNTTPEQIRIDIVEERPLKPKIKLNKIFVPVPRLADGNIEGDSSLLEFSSSKSIQSDFGIGSGQFCIRRSNQQQLIGGLLSLKIGWKEAGNGSSTIPQKQVTSSSLQKIYDDPSKYDPMNPSLKFRGEQYESNEDDDDEGDEDNPKSFTFQEDELTFCSEEELKSNQRMNILRERAKKNKKYKDFKLVPTSDRQVVEASEVPQRIIDESLGMDPIDLTRFRGKKYLLEVYSTISNYCKTLDEESNGNLLLTEQMPTFSSMVTAFLRLFGPNRPLKPTRKRQGSHRPCRNIDVRQFNVSLNIVRAFGIPHRQDEALLSTRKSSNLSSPNTTGYRPINIRPFVTASFKGISARTSTGDGSNPTWNEQLALPLSLKSWDEMKGCLIVQLFDEYVDDILEDDRNRLTDIYQRISSKFIGELRIPLADLYFSQRIEGTFEMNSPPLLGYTKSPTRSPPQSQSAPVNSFAGSNINPDLKGPIFVSLLITLEPCFQHDYFTTKHLECTEADQLKITVGRWMYDFHLEFPWRSMDPYVTLLNGKRAFIMNIMGAINTPFADTEEKEKQEGLVRRYVSLIPTLQTTDPSVQRCGVWLLNDQIFNTLRCSQKDLAVLLVNFYLELGLDAWLMIGESQLRKNSCFVLLKESPTEYSIVDPVTGRKYQSTDIYCPLNSIHFLVNDRNLWGNIQMERKVFMTRFDANNTSDWRSLFKRSQDFLRSGFLQEQNYSYKTAYDIRNIHAVIEAKLTKKIGQWRGHRKTVWNRIVRDNLRRILVELEKDATTEYAENGNHLEKLNFLTNNFKVSGCPLNMSYLNLSHVVERVKATGIHLTTDPRVEFGLSVYVHPYPNFVISVWVFLIALLPK